MQTVLFLCVAGWLGISQGLNITVGMMLPKDDPKLKPKIGFGTSAGALTIALNRIKAEQLLPGVEWNFVWKWPECEESLAMRIAVELMTQDKIDVLIGPPCSIAAILAGILGKIYDVPLVSWGATDPDLDSTARFPTFARTVPSAKTLGKAIMDTLIYFNWEEYAMIYSDDGYQRNCYYIYQGFREEQDEMQDIRNNVLVKTQASPTDEEIDDFIQKVKTNARIIFICFDLRRDQRRFLLRAHAAKLKLDEYVFIFARNLAEEGEFWLADVPDGKDVDAYNVARHSYTLEWAAMEQADLKDFKKKVPKIMAQWPFFYTSNLSDEQMVGCKLN